MLDSEMSAFVAEKVFDLAKAEFEQGDPDRIRAGEIGSYWQGLL